MARKNRIVEAFDEEENLDTPEVSEDDLDEELEAEAGEFLAYEQGNKFSDEEVLDLAETRHNQERGQKRKQRTDARDTRRRTTAASAQEAARDPIRERDIQWQPASSLEAPPPLPGMEQRWIRFQNGDKNDPRNWSRKMREGWVPRKLDTVPAGFVAATIKHAMGEVIGNEDLILCERKLEIGAARRRHFDLKTLRQQAAVRRQHVDKVERNGHGIDVEEKRSKPTVGRGTRRPQVQGDE